MTEKAEELLHEDGKTGLTMAEVPLEKLIIDETFNIDPARSKDDEIVVPMMDAIRLQGLLEPPIVTIRPAEGPNDPLAYKGFRFFVAGGFVRCEAMKRLGWKVTTVVVKKTDTELQAVLINGSENASRRQVHPYCLAKRFKLLRDHYKMTVEEIAKHHSYTPTYVEMLIRTYSNSIPEIRDGFFKNLAVDESRVPPFQWLQWNAKQTPEEQKEAYERKYGKLRDERRERDADEGEPEIGPEKVVRAKRRSVDAILQCIDKDLAKGAPVELNLLAFAKDPRLSDRERIIAKAFLYWSADAKKQYPLRKVKQAEGAKKKPAETEDEEHLPTELEDV